MSIDGYPRQQVLHPMEGESRTKQADLKAADINNIVRRWLKSGIPPQSNMVARYGDFSNSGDYLSCLLKVQESQDSFMRLPARVRKACDNDPGKFLDMVFDPEKKAQLVELGLVEGQTPVEPAPEVPEEPPVEP